MPSRRSHAYGRPDADHFRRRALPPAPPDPAATELDATITAVVFAKDDGSFAILRGVDDEDRKVVVRGPLAHVNVGESVTATGRWTEHPRHGWGFDAAHAEARTPRSAAGMVAYLESSVHGIGPVWAKAIVDTLGDETFDLIDADPKVLFEVKSPSGRSMSAKQVREIIGSWDDARAVRRVMHFLVSNGVTPGIASRIHGQYGDEALERMQHDPYCIVEIRGIGFRIADRIARNMNVPLESPRRLRAGIVYCLEEAEGDGHCFLGDEELASQVRETLFFDGNDDRPEDVDDEEDRPDSARLDEVVSRELAALVKANRLVLDVDESGRRYYLPELHRMELRLARNLRAMLADGPADDLELPTRPEGGDFVPNDGQWRAIEHAFTSRVSLITGLPGTGKTTLVQQLVREIEAQGQIVLGPGTERHVLASPTGKAARRLAEATGRDAKTIHRLLQYSPQDGGFVHGEDRPLQARFVIVDETSMVDIRLADALVRAIGPRTHLVLVGDADQLPPVGAGKVFDDLIASNAIPGVRLDEIFRQAARSTIVRNAHRIVEGVKPFRNRTDAAESLGLEVEELDDDYFFVHRDDPEDVARMIVEFAAERIPRKYGLDPFRDVLVLAPMKKGPCGLEALNRSLQWRLNRDGAPIGVRDHRVGDRVIQTRNDYDLEVMNGEVGVILAHDAEDGEVVVAFDEREIVMPARQLETFLPAYAISIHRSQGSQAPAVVCAVAKSHWIMLTRSLVNTAITRAQRLCVCVGQSMAMAHAVRTPDARRRNSALAERLAAPSGAGADGAAAAGGAAGADADAEAGATDAAPPVAG